MTTRASLAVRATTFASTLLYSFETTFSPISLA